MISVRLSPARAQVAPISGPVVTIRVRLSPARAQVAPISGQVVTIRVRLSPARAQVAPISGQVLTIRVRLPPERSWVATMSGPLATIRALRLTMRAATKHLTVHSRVFRPHARTKSTQRNLVPLRDVLARLSHSRARRRETSKLGGTRPDTVPRTEGGS